MHNTLNQNFKIVAAITGYELRKSADGTEKYVLSGMASNTNIDLTGERMAESAIQAMAKSLEDNAVTINNEHGSSWDDDFGEVTKLWVTPSHELMMEAELDPDHYRTKTLIKALDKGKKLGLSIGGVVKEAAMEWFADLGRKVMTYKDIALFHVAITGTPAVADTWVTPITKSVKDWKETPMPEDKDKVEKTDEQADQVEVTEQPQEQAPADEHESAPAEGDAPEASDDDTTEKSADEGEKPEAEETPADETAPVESEAPAQKDEEAAPDGEETAKSAPAPAEDNTSEVAKSAIFGSYSAANAAEISVKELSAELCWQVWLAVRTTEEDERTPQERKEHVATALAEFAPLVQGVADAFIDNGAPAEAEKTFVFPSEEAINKSLTEKDTKVEELTKSLSDTTAELETVQKSLEEKEAELEKINARKGIVFDKFSGQEVEKTDAQSIQKASQQKWAGFITGGVR